MKKLLTALPLLFVLLSCKTPQVGEKPANQGIVSVVIDCGVDSVRAHAPDIIPAISSALTGADFLAIEVLVARYGIDVVSCVIDHVTKTSEAQVVAASSGNVDPLAVARVKNGQQWLAEHKVKFQ